MRWARSVTCKKEMTNTYDTLAEKSEGKKRFGEASLDIGIKTMYLEIYCDE
jgi:hypothetical protein